MGIRGQYKNKRDANEKDIFAQLEAYGLMVEPIDTPVDAIVGYMGRSYLVEVKNPKGKNKISPPQEAFFARWNGGYTILRTVEEASEFASKIRAIA